MLALPQGDCLRMPARSLDSAMKERASAAVRYACADFLAAASEFYRVPSTLSAIASAKAALRRRGQAPARLRKAGAMEALGIGRVWN